MLKIYIVPTPIGNLKDITLRALEVLENADCILAEDTRKSKRLLQHYKISSKILSYHQHNEHKQIKKIIKEIKSGTIFTLISDAGTPSVSDPGFLLVRECIKNDIIIETLPGATALIPALVNSGLSSDKFVFEGFLPVKKGRTKRLLKLSDEERTIILYESPHRIIKTLKSLIEILGNDRRASISRELTKVYEENIRGTLQELLDYYSINVLKGEFVIVIEGNK
tara:strand:+ start:300 stop:971 length:672 start_codon:yes stop_codon:yes gene_type:complete